MAKRRKKKQPHTPWIILSGVVVLGLAVFSLLSLVSFDHTDYNHEIFAPQPKNFCGQFGAAAAEFLFGSLGLSAYALVALLAGWGGILLVGKLPRHAWLRIAGSVFLLASLASADGLMVFSRTGLPAHEELLIQQDGGKVGAFFSDTLRRPLGVPGSMILFTVVFALSLLLAADQVVIRLGSWSLRGIKLVGQWSIEKVLDAWDRFAEWREERALRQEEEAEAREEEEDEYEDEEYEDEDEEEYEDEEEEEPEPEPHKWPKRKAKVKIRKEKVAPFGSGARAKPIKPMMPQLESELFKDYKLPAVEMLEDPAPFDASDIDEQIVRNIATLERTLTEFGVDARVVETDRGPVVTLYALELAPGITVKRIISLGPDLSRAMKSTGLRIQAPIPGTPYVGIEIPNASKEQVCLKEILGSPDFKEEKYIIPIVLGKDVAGAPIVQDLTRMPHLLIAGTTGSGKSVCINSIILSILFTRYPSDVKLLLVDPKMVELTAYSDIPHLMHPVITNMRKAPQVLEWAVKNMEDRYGYLARTGTRDIAQYNKLGEKKINEALEKTGGEPGEIPYNLPYIVIVIDELADLMMTAKKEVESQIIRLAQKSRAIGIHLVLATQRPIVAVITGLIKSNISARVAFRVFSKLDSRVILDDAGAETLLGEGDMLTLVPGITKPVRAQGSFVSDQEIVRVTNFIKEQAKPNYSRELQQWGAAGMVEGDKDPLFDRAAEVVIESRRGSASLLQRALTIGYTRASRLMEQLAMEGIVGEFTGSKARDVLVTPDDWEQMKQKEGQQSG